MKKILVIAALAIFSFANAQKGSILVMGSVDYNSQNVSNSNTGEDTDQYTFNFLPKVGYQFHENWTAGIEARFGSGKQKFVNNSESKNTNYAVGGFLRYTKPLNETFSAYADLGIGFQNTKTTNSSDILSSTNKGDGFYVGITPAVLINVGKGFGLNFNIGGLGYSTLNYDDINGQGDEYKNFNFSFGRSFAVGISKNF